VRVARFIHSHRTDGQGRPVTLRRRKSIESGPSIAARSRDVLQGDRLAAIGRQRRPPIAKRIGD
jgi:hypothetical protein